MRIALALFSLLMLVPIVNAEETPSSEQIAQAKQHYFSGERAYRLGDFDRAIAEFKQSYDLNPAPRVLFNLGQAHYKKNDLTSAQHFFRQFIDTNPTGPELASAKQKLADVEAQLQKEQAALSATNTLDPSTLAANRKKRAAFLTLGSVGIAAAVGGAIALGITASQNGDVICNLDPNGGFAGCGAQRRNTTAAMAASGVVLGLGVVAAAVGFGLAHRYAKKGIALAPLLFADGGGLALGGNL